MDHSRHHPDAATDPVCGMKLKVADAQNTADHEGHTYYFCSKRCLDKFTAEP
ncbi:MAG: YHS domain-containing protein, partial [Betaproteobacteria bacterium]